MMKKKRLSYLEIIVIALIVGVLAAILLPALARRRNLMNIRVCASNLKELAKSLSLYADENKYRYPPIDTTKNNFMFDANLMYPEYLTDPTMAMCPAALRRDPDTSFRLGSDHSADGTPKGDVHPDCFTDGSYVYLGWMVMNDKEVEAFFEAYDKLPMEDYDANILVPEGWGTLEGDTIHRLSSGVDRFLITDINAVTVIDDVGSSIIPIMLDRPFTDTSQFNHRPVGGNVLYLIGHTDYHRLEANFHPMTEKMARLLDERPREPIPDCE